MPAPTYPDYPTADDVENHLRSTGIWPEDDENGNNPTPEQERAVSQAEIAIDKVISEWEERVNWLPFLAKGELDEERDFDSISSEGYINLEGGIVTVSSLTIAGEVLTLGTDYRLEPRNAPLKGKPFEEIRLLNRRHQVLRDLGQITVAAKWGYSTSVPADVWGAMVETAGRIVMTHLRSSPGIGEISQDGFAKSYDTVGTITSQDLVKLWEESFKNIYTRYKRVVLG